MSKTEGIPIIHMGNLGNTYREMTQVKQAMAKVFQNPDECMCLKTVHLRNRGLMPWEAILSVPLLWDKVACSSCTDYYKAVVWVSSTGPCPDAIWIPNPTVGNGLAGAQQFMKARPSVYCLIQEIPSLNLTFLLDCSDGPAEVRASKH